MVQLSVQPEELPSGYSEDGSVEFGSRRVLANRKIRGSVVRASRAAVSDPRAGLGRRLSGRYAAGCALQWSACAPANGTVRMGGCGLAQQVCTEDCRKPQRNDSNENIVSEEQKLRVDNSRVEISIPGGKNMLITCKESAQRGRWQLRERMGGERRERAAPIIGNEWMARPCRWTGLRYLARHRVMTRGKSTPRGNNQEMEMRRGKKRAGCLQ